MILLLCMFFLFSNVLFAQESKISNYISEKDSILAIPAQGQFEAYNARDIDGFVQWFDDDVVLRRFGTNEILSSGIEQIRERYGKMFSEKKELHCNLVKRIVTGNYVIDEELVTGLREGMVHATAIYRIEDKKIKEFWLITE